MIGSSWIVGLDMDWIIQMDYPNRFGLDMDNPLGVVTLSKTRTTAVSVGRTRNTELSLGNECNPTIVHCVLSARKRAVWIIQNPTKFVGLDNG